MFLEKGNAIKSHFHVCQMKILLLLLLLLLWQWSIKDNANNAGIFLSSVKPECREWQASVSTTLQADAWASVRTLRQDVAFCAQNKMVKHDNTFSTYSMAALPASQQIQLQQGHQLCAKIAYVIIPCPHKSIWQHIQQSFPYPGKV